MPALSGRPSGRASRSRAKVLGCLPPTCATKTTTSRCSHSDLSLGTSSRCNDRLGFDEQDVRLGMDTCCLVTSAGPVMYGGVEECTISDGVARLVFTTEAVETLGVPPDVSIAIEADDVPGITSALTRMLR